MEIRYEIKRGEHVTVCKHYPHVRVGSRWCEKCQYHWGADDEYKIVICNKEETK